MNPAAWNSVKSVFFEAMALEPAERDAFLRDLEAADSQISAQLRALLADPADDGPDLRHPCWGPAVQQSPRHAFDLGRRLQDRFEIVEFLGSGGVGEVYRAFDHDQKTFIAVKTLRPNMSSDPVAISSLRKELNSARAVTHPNVCRVFDIHWSRGGASPTFFTMEFLDGETLANCLKHDGPFPQAAADALALQILDGLEAIHGQGIVHRDLKSNNIMLVNGRRRAMLMDFGLAREMDESGDLLTTLASSHFAGTPAYMAPEQLRGGPASFSSDIHALGVVLCEIATGRRPFEGATSVEAVAKRLNGDAPSPKRYAPRLEPRWEYTILKCLEAEPRKRPQSVDAVRQLLTGAPPHLWRSRRAFIAAGIAAAGTAAAALVLPRRSGTSDARLVVGDFENRTGNAALDYLTKGTTSEIVRRLTGLRGLDVIRLYRTKLRPAKGLFLQGQLASVGSDLEWTLRLNDQTSATTVWAKAFSQKSGQSVLDVQNEIANEVRTRLLAYQGEPHPAAAPSGSPTSQALAFDLYMRARFLLESPSPVSTRAALPYLRQAIESDPNFALAWSAMADANLALMNYDPDQSNNLFRQALDCATRAVDLDPRLAEAYASLAAVRQQAMDWPASEQSYQQALKLKPFFPRAHRWYAGFVLQFGRIAEALDQSQIALRQDPYDQMAPMAIGMYFILCGKLTDAIALMEPAVAGKDMETTRHNLGFAYARMALTPGAEKFAWLMKAFAQADAVAAIERRQKKERPLLSDIMYALFHGTAGNRTDFDKYVGRLKEDMDAGRAPAEHVACAYGASGDNLSALEFLERGYSESPSSLLYIKVNPFYEKLRDEPRFQRLIHDLRL